MTDVFIERTDKGDYVIRQNKTIIGRGETQAEAIDKAREKRPDDSIMVERVRNTDVGSRDKWRKP